MNNKYDNEKWAEIFENYYCGMTQRELEKKYFPLTIRTIARSCKMVMINLMTNPDGIIRKNYKKINQEILEATRKRLKHEN